MLSLDVNEFIERIDKMLLKVVEEGEMIEITKQNEIIARMVPVRKQGQADIQDDLAAWHELERISAEISACWPRGLSAVDAVQDARQESQ
jgi:antitoxin (DNA-binding transcriptional repressor) of toxin-antitoxin stability system